jgi:hypothetical protein
MITLSSVIYFITTCLIILAFVYNSFLCILLAGLGLGVGFIASFSIDNIEENPKNE